jgi:hypothetical protein
MARELSPAAKKWIDLIFAPIAAAVQDFASRYDMRLDKYSIGKGDWMLVGKHTKGGNIILVLRYDLIRTLVITGLWQVGCPEKSLFHTHVRPGRKCRLDPEAVIAVLENELAALAATEYGSWTCTRPFPKCDANLSFGIDRN